MAFTQTNFKPLSRRKGLGGQRLWHYQQATDVLATIAASGYFNAVASQLSKGDIIFVYDTAAPTYDILFVTSASRAATVTTANAT
jgi:hypothetical protein